MQKIRLWLNLTKLNWLLIRAYVLQRFFKEKYPNFDGSMPRDEFFKIFHRAFNLEHSSGEAFLMSARDMGFLALDGGKNYRLEKALDLELKLLLDIEKAQGDSLFNALIDKLKKLNYDFKER